MNRRRIRRRGAVACRDLHYNSQRTQTNQKTHRDHGESKKRRLERNEGSAVWTLQIPRYARDESYARKYTVQPCHHFVPPGATAPMYGVGTTNVPAFVWIFPVKLFMPPVAIGEPVAGEKSKALTPFGTEPV